MRNRIRLMDEGIKFITKQALILNLSNFNPKNEKEVIFSIDDIARTDIHGLWGQERQDG